MTIEELVEQLKFEDEWALGLMETAAAGRSAGPLRDKHGCCPIEAVLLGHTPGRQGSELERAAIDADMTYEEARCIIDAADDRFYYENRRPHEVTKLRYRMLQHLGIGS